MKHIFFFPVKEKKVGLKKYIDDSLLYTTGNFLKILPVQKYMKLYRYCIPKVGINARTQKFSGMPTHIGHSKSKIHGIRHSSWPNPRTLTV